MENKTFRACFIVEVQFSDDMIILVDSYKQEYIIEKVNIDAVKSFKVWFTTVFKKCIPQTLTMLDYYVSNKLGEPACIVNDIVSYTGRE